MEIRNAETPLASLCVVRLGPVKVERLTKNDGYTVADFTMSDDGKWVGFRGIAADRYKRNITEQNINSDPYLLEVATGQIERLTENVEVGESGLSFSPDGRWVAFSAPDDLTRYSMKNQRVYLRAPADRGGRWRKLGASFDGDVSVSFWSKDGGTIYFNEGIRATNQLLALDVAKDSVRQLTNEKGDGVGGPGRGLRACCSSTTPTAPLRRPLHRGRHRSDRHPLRLEAADRRRTRR